MHDSLNYHDDQFDLCDTLTALAIALKRERVIVVTVARRVEGADGGATKP